MFYFSFYFYSCLLASCLLSFFAYFYIISSHRVASRMVHVSSPIPFRPTKSRSCTKSGKNSLATLSAASCTTTSSWCVFLLYIILHCNYTSRRRCSRLFLASRSSPLFLSSMPLSITKTVGFEKNLRECPHLHRFSFEKSYVLKRALLFNATTRRSNLMSRRKPSPSPSLLLTLRY